MEVWGLMDDGFGGLRDFSKGGIADVSFQFELDLKTQSKLTL